MTGDGRPVPDGSGSDDGRPVPDGSGSDEGPPVTVVTVSYFSADSIGDCLDSVVSQSGVEPRVIVVDNGAPEATGETETEGICADYDAVEYVASDANDGYGAGVNRGFARADTEYLAAINPDATFGDGALRRLVDRLGAGDGNASDGPEGVAFAAPKILLADDPDTISTCGLVNHFTGVSFNQGAGRHRDHPDWTRERDLGSLSGCAFATTAAAWQRVGSFDEEIFLYKDDVDLSWACQLLGERVRFVPDAVVFHDFERGLDGFKLHHIERSRMLLLAKYLPASAALLAPSLLLAELLTWAMAATLGGDALRGKLRAYGVLASPDARSIRRKGERFRREFPERVAGLDTTVPWQDLRRTGIVPDSPLVAAGGRLVDLVFRANLALYRSVVSRER